MKKVVCLVGALLLATGFLRASVTLSGAATSGLELSTGTITAYPLSMACWFNADTTVDGTLLAVSDTATGGNYIELVLRDAGDAVCLTVSDTGSGANELCATGSFSTGSWQHAAARLTNATSREVFRDGGNSQTSAFSRTPTGEDRTGVGVMQTSAGEQTSFDGSLADCAIWDEALSDEEVAALAAGWQAIAVRPHALFAYWPFYSNGRDMKNNRPFAEADGESYANTNHPRLNLGTMTPP